VIALYLESLGNPRKFARLARRVAARVPVLVVKGGRSDGGRRAGLSHTAAAATSDVVVDALFAQAGVIRLDTVEDQVDLARLLESQPLPAGGRLVVVGNGGGVGVLAADAAQSAGLDVPGLSAGVRTALGPTATDNPVDLGAAVTPDQLRTALERIAAGGEADVLLAAVAVTGTVEPAAMLAAVGAADIADVPVAVTVVGGASDLTAVPLARGDLAPVYAFPERAVRALAQAVSYGRWRRSPIGTPRRPSDVHGAAARALVADRMPAGDDPGWLPAPTVADLLGCYGIAAAPVRAASSPAEAVAAAADLGYPVVLKTGRADVVHKTEVGGVRLGLGSPEQVRAAYADLAERLGGDVLVQPTVPAVAELVVGMSHEQAYGPVVMLGLGGVLTDLLADRIFRMLPLTDLDARQMVLGLRCSPLLMGYRGAERADVESVEDLLHRVSALATDLPEVAELDLNPVMVGGAGAVVADARVRLAAPQPVPDETARALRTAPGPGPS
jgi:acyl-CoA synthetase (NDP forming)